MSWNQYINYNHEENKVRKQYKEFVLQFQWNEETYLFDWEYYKDRLIPAAGINKMAVYKTKPQFEGDSDFFYYFYISDPKFKNFSVFRDSNKLYGPKRFLYDKFQKAVRPTYHPITYYKYSFKNNSDYDCLFLLGNPYEKTASSTMSKDEHLKNYTSLSTHQEKYSYIIKHNLLSHASFFENNDQRLYNLKQKLADDKERFVESDSDNCVNN